MGKVYTLKYNYGGYGYQGCYNVAASTNLERIEFERTKIIEESQKYSQDKTNLKSKIGKYYQEELINNNLVPPKYFNDSQAAHDLFNHIEDRYLAPTRACSGLISDLFRKDTGLPKITTPEYYYCRYPMPLNKQAANLAFSIPDDSLKKLMENKPKGTEIKVPQFVGEPEDFIIEETDLI